MNQFHIDIHMITRFAVIIHRIYISEDEDLSKCVDQLNVLLESSREFTKNLPKNDAMRVTKKFIYATEIHKEAFINEAAIVEHNSVKDFFNSIGFDVQFNNIQKISYADIIL